MIDPLNTQNQQQSHQNTQAQQAGDMFWQSNNDSFDFGSGW